MGTKRPLSTFLSASEVMQSRPPAAYEYRALAELSGLVGEFVNVMGRIIDHKTPTITKVQEWCLALTIADATCPLGFRVTMFAKRQEDLPLADQSDSSVGRVARIIRMKVCPFGEKTVGTAWATSAQNQRNSVLAFQEGSASAFLVYPATPHLSLTEAEERLIRELLSWAPATVAYAPRQPARPAPPPAAAGAGAVPAAAAQARPARASSRLLVPVSQVSAEMTYVDFIGKLVRIETHKAGGTKLLFWDGTHKDQLEATSETPPCSLLPVMVWSELQNQPGKFETEKWLRLSNMQIQSKHGLEGHMRNRPDTRIELISDADPIVHNRLSEWTARQQQHLLEQRRGPALAVPAAIPPPLPNLSAAAAASLHSKTRASHPHVRASSLMRIKTWPNPPYKFRCVNLSVLGHLPADVRDITRPFCTACKVVAERVTLPDGGRKCRCPNCQKDLVNPPFIYMFSLIVSDGRTSVRVILYKQDAEYFFGLAAHDLYQNNVSLSVLTAMLQQLMTPTARIDCCVQVYYRSDAIACPNGRRARRLRMFDTTMVHSGS